MLNSKVYDILKYVMQIALPAVGTLYFALSQIWGLPYGAETVGSITAIDAFLGILLNLSSKVYNNSDAKYAGSINVDNTDTKKTFSLNLNGDPDEIENKKEIIFKVNTVENLPVKKAAAK